MLALTDPTANDSAVLRTAALTAASLIAFAANSILCRLALADGSIDALSFTSIRLASGAAALWLVVAATGRRPDAGRGAPRALGGWLGPATLFVYAIAFSLAYRELPAATGALMLFGAVQVTMMVAGCVGGERPGTAQWVGFVVAAAGLVYLVSPGLAAPAPLGAALMLSSGVAWGLYSLTGRRSTSPVADTAQNFARSVPLALIASVVGIVAAGLPRLTASGALWAVISGALTSGGGYVLWYQALRGLSATRASIVQLAVPVIAAVGAVLLLGESVSLRLVVAAASILGGIAMALARRGRIHRS